MPLELLFLMCHYLLGGNLIAFGANKVGLGANLRAVDLLVASIKLAPMF